ncbi:MAG: STAS domain-containing protein [Lachnospiraceae bacterium]|nr:STAS domain-containing protein [Lachnospiraceae bacterium]
MFEYDVKNQNDVVDVTLKGRLDATHASDLLEEMKKFIGTPISKIIFHVAELEYIASAGLRVIIFTKQKIGYDAEVLLESPNETVQSVVDMTGLDNFITII